VEETVDKDMHRSVTGCGRASDRRPVGFGGLQGFDKYEYLGVIQKCARPHNHSNNLLLRILI
jgi:hypothetical protein